MKNLIKREIERARAQNERKIENKSATEHQHKKMIKFQKIILEKKSSSVSQRKFRIFQLLNTEDTSHRLK